MPWLTRYHYYAPPPLRVIKKFCATSTSFRLFVVCWSVLCGMFMFKWVCVIDLAVFIMTAWDGFSEGVKSHATLM